MAVALLASGCLLLLLEVGTVAAGEGRSVPQSSPQAFERWAARHGRSYGSAEERVRAPIHVTGTLLYTSPSPPLLLPYKSLPPSYTNLNPTSCAGAAAGGLFGEHGVD